MKVKEKAIIGAITLLLTASGVVGYQVVKTRNYSGMEKNLHQVVSVIDGDTFEVSGVGDEEKVVVRILNISAPDRGECFFAEATNELRGLIENKKVRLEKDISGEDSYGRLLRHVILPSGSEREDDVLVSQYMIKKGMATAVPTTPDLRYKTHLANVEGDLDKKKLGIWGNCEQLPKDFVATKDAQPDDLDCVIKGNISTTGAGRLYFLENCPSYSQIKIDLKRGERYFCTEEEAIDAGFVKSPSCENVF